jgi:UrcA family protein
MSTFIPARAAGSPAKFTLLLLGSLAGVLVADAASAAGAASATGDVPAVSVKYSQESLATNGGVYDLYRRITIAAKQVCPDVSIRDLSALRQVAVCREQAVARAISQIDNPKLAALHASRSKNG